MNKLQKIQARARSDYFFFCKEILGYSKMRTTPHQELCDFIEQPGNRKKLVLMPRGSFKSSVVTVGYPLFRLLENPNLRVLIAGETQKNSKTFSKEIKTHLEQNQRFRALFGDWVSTNNTWRDDAFLINRRTIVKKEPTIMSASVEKMTVTGLHFDCLDPRTEILTSNGLKSVKNIRINEWVYGVDGKFHRVVATRKKITRKPLVRIRAQYQSKSVIMTNDHRVLVFRDGAIQWVGAGTVAKSDFLAIPKIHGATRAVSRSDPQIDRLLGEPEIWRFIGYWLAEGCHTQTSKGCNTIRLTIGSHEDAIRRDITGIIKRTIGITAAVRNTPSNTAVISFSHGPLKTILKKFGSHAYNKHLPPFALNALKHFQRELVKGYFSGDGSITGSVVTFASSSYQLLLGIQLILASMNIASGIARNRKAGQATVVGNKCRVKDGFNLTSTHPYLKLLLGVVAQFPTRPTRSFFLKNFWLVPIQSLSKIQTVQKKHYVYDIQVKDSESFYCPGVLAHNCVILDDPVSKLNINTPEQLQKTIDCYKMLLSVLEPDGMIIVVGTRYSPADLYGWLSDDDSPENGQIDILIKQAEDEAGNLLMPEILTRQFLDEQKKTQGTFIFTCQYLNNAVSPDICTFKQEQIKFYAGEPKGLIYFLTVDAAISSQKSSDYTGLILNGVDHRHNWYIDEALQIRADPQEVITTIFRMVQKHGENNFMCLGMESFAFEKFLKHGLLAEMEKRSYYFPIKEIETNNRVSKEARIRSLQPRFENGSIYIRKEHQVLYHQILYHPQLKNDDLIDALKNQLSITYPSPYVLDMVMTEQDKRNEKLTQNERWAWDNAEKQISRRVKERSPHSL